MNVSRAVGIVWRDFTLLMVLGFVAMVVILLPFVNPPAEEDEGAPPPGNYLINVYWPPGCNSDVDTWIFGLGEARPIGYSNKSGVVWNLLRDDLGAPDEDRNFENAYSRGVMAGEIIVNIHAFRIPPNCFPVPVEVEVALNTGKPGKASIKKLVTTTVKLTRKGEERTAIRFKVDGEGNVVPGSMNSVFRPLRAASGFSPSGNNPDYGG